MSLIHIFILAVIQGLAELLPVSSSAHVIIAQKAMGFDPTSPEMTLLLVMLHTGTMFATVIYFWKKWKEMWLSPERNAWLRNVFVATVLTLVSGFSIKWILEHFIFRHNNFEVEDLFGKLPLVASALFAVGVFIVYSGIRSEKNELTKPVDRLAAIKIGLVQGLALPFRGFSRSGATISTGLLMGCERLQVEAFSFLLAVVLTPPVILRAFWRLHKHRGENADFSWMQSIQPGLIGMFASFVAGLLALKFLTAVLERGRWTYFGIYCLVASLVVFYLNSILV
jgi:undecaprenyl-diphosphatase